MLTLPDRPAPPPDGRQSPHAATVQRGVGRFLRARGLVMVTELPLATGRRADIVAVAPGGEVWIVEIKSSIEDFRVDRKWPDYRLSCDRLFFATHAAVPLDIFPGDAGLLLADAYGGELVREAPEHRLAAGARKALLIRFAQAAAARLHGLADPAVGADPFALA
ncbi:MAG TPA: MmcB family DNA repair protein [Bauldia sp.]|nr:MmcB family DNA repair protein [Bauldia sp.]